MRISTTQTMVAVGVIAPQGSNCPDGETAASVDGIVDFVSTRESDWEHFYDLTADNESTFTEEELVLFADYSCDKYSNVSSNGRPKWKIDNVGKDVVITFGDARKKVWEVAKAETQACRERIVRLTNKSFDSVGLEDILFLFLGKSRPLMQLMESELHLEFKDAAHFLATHCVQKAYRVSVEAMCDDEDEFLDTTGLMAKEKHKAAWKLIGQSGSSPRERNRKPFWEKFQDRFNETCQEINVSQESSVLVSLDDDKKNAANTNEEGDMHGLKPAVHTNRRKGIIGHTAMSPATLLTYGVIWEQDGDSSHDCYVRLVKTIFGNKPKLDRVTFCSDRGYWILKLLEYLLENGADVHGTVRRQHWCEFTCDQELKVGDPRISIDKVGPATLYSAVGKIADRDVDINAFRTGTNAVALTMSSVYHGACWDCVVMDEKQISTKIHLLTSPEWRRALTFRLFGSNVALDNNLVMSELGRLEIEHVTEYQSHQEWMKARQNSLTSSGVDTQVAIQLRLDKQRDQRRQHWVVLENYLHTAFGLEDDGVGAVAASGGGTTVSGAGAVAVTASARGTTVSGAGAVAVTASGGGTTVAGDSTNTMFDLDGDEFDSDMDVEDRLRVCEDRKEAEENARLAAQEMLADATDSTERNSECCKNLITELKSGSHKPLLDALVKQMGWKPCKSSASNLKNAITWLEATPATRPHIVLNKNQLKVRHNASRGCFIPKDLTLLSLTICISV